MRRSALLVALALTVAACSSSSGGDAAPATTTSAASTTSEAATTTTVAAEPGHYREVVEALAGNAFEGRNNQTPGSTKAQDFLVGQLQEFAEPLGGDFRHPFTKGTNLLGLIPGGDLKDQYVIIGAHYDHLGSKCRTTDPADVVCNGAADNAAGVASALDVGRRLAAGKPRRSVIIALWDAEEDGLQGSASYVTTPVVPLAQTTAYLNWDIQGVNLLPSLRDTTVVVGAETGGKILEDDATAAAKASDLQPLQLSLLFGQGRSDHAVFANAKVPTVFFTDANSACYHTSQDDLTTIDLDKLGREIPIGTALAEDLVDTDTPPTFVADTPAATFGDAESMLAVVSRAKPDFSIYDAASQAMATKYLADLQAIVTAGEGAFDQADVGTVLAGAAAVVDLLTKGPCDGYVG